MKLFLLAAQLALATAEIGKYEKFLTNVVNVAYKL